MSDNKEPFDYVTYETMKAEILNERVGNLEYYNCELCKNKGVIYKVKVDKNNAYQYAETCKCMDIRKTFRNLENCGIDKSTLDRYTFDNFETTQTWQERMKNICLGFVDKIRTNTQDKHNWLTISGISGCGKTMLCTAIFKDLILIGLKGRYFMWKEDIPKIKSLKKSSFTESIGKYESIMNELKTIDVLYIDDFLKLVDKQEKESDLNLAYEILNSRYINNKITIISTEFSKDELSRFDTAICGRITEKCGSQFIQLAYDENRNYRMKKV